MRNIKLILEYDGTKFSGWQEQPNARTVQWVIQKSLKKIFGKDISIIGSGRTDAGVHAAAQVANFSIDSEMSLNKIKAALNGTMPKDIRVTSVDDVPDDFHSRFAAKKREYHYKIALQEKAILRHFSWYCPFPIDLDRVKEASLYLIGKHNFQSFCQSRAKVNHYNCNIESIEWLETEDNFLIFKIIANRFLHNMVRVIVGTLLEVGFNKIEPKEIDTILKSENRINAGPTVSAKGLCLIKVYY